MASIKFTNFANSQLAAGVNASATSFVLETGQGARFPSLGAGDYFYLTVENASLAREIVKCTARSTDTLTVVRAQDNTTASSWSAGDTVALRLNAAALDDVLGGVQVTLDNEVTLTNKTLTSPVLDGAPDFTGSVRSSIVAVAALDINCASGNFFTKTINANSTFTFSNPPSAKAYSFTLELTHTSGSVTWPSSVRWPGGIAPTISAASTSLFMFVTDDGGARWRGAALSNYTT